MLPQCCDPFSNVTNCSVTFYKHHNGSLSDLSYIRNCHLPVIIFTALSAYLLAVTVYREWRHKKQKRVPLSHRILPISMFAVTLYSIQTLCDLFLGQVGKEGCNGLHWSATIFYSGGSCLVYTILWSRQRKFYSDPLLKHSVGKVSRRISSVVIFVIYFLLVGSAFAFEFTYCLVSTIEGCVVLWETHWGYFSVVPIVFTFMSVCLLSQITLLGLIAYPLVSGSSALCHTLASVCKPARNDIESMLRRLLYCTLFCIATTQISGLFIILDATGVIRVYWSLILQLDLFFNNFAIIFTFADWQQRLLPGVYKSRSRNESTTESIPL